MEGHTVSGCHLGCKNSILRGSECQGGKGNGRLAQKGYRLDTWRALECHLYVEAAKEAGVVSNVFPLIIVLSKAVSIVMVIGSLHAIPFEFKLILGGTGIIIRKSLSHLHYSYQS